MVADQISSEAKTYLGELGGWGRLDRRTGELRLTNERNNYAFEVTRPATDSPIRGQAGIAYAVTLCSGPWRRFGSHSGSPPWPASLPCATSTNARPA